MNTLLFVMVTASLAMSMVILLLLLLNKVLARKVPAVFRYYMWLVVLLGLLIPFRPSIALPFAPVQIPIVLETAQAQELPAALTPNEIFPAEHAVAAPAPEAGKPPVPYVPILFGVWVGGILLVLAFHLRIYGKFAASARRWGVEVTDEQTLSALQKVWEDMELPGTRIAVKECVFLSSPMLIGYRQPQILLPEKTISPDELEHIFRHELTHYRRKDLWMNMLVVLVSAIHWFNPFVYLMAKKIREDCEVACDEAAVAGRDTAKRKHYGETIIGFIGTKNPGTPVLSTYFYGGKNNMKKRLFSIMDTSRKRKGLAAMCLAAVLALTLLSGTIFAASSQQEAGSAPYVGEEKAKSIALKHAGVSTSQVTFIKAHLDREDGRMVYDIEFYSGNTEYDYEIDAVNGSIQSYDRDIENYTVPQPTTVPKPTTQPATTTAPQYIGEEKAKSIALKHAGVSASQVTFIKAHLDREDGHTVYDIEFYSGNTEYDYEIDAVNGDIRAYDKDIEGYAIPKPTQTTTQPATTTAPQYIGEAKAKSLALSAAGLSESQVSRLTVKLEREDGAMVYEVDFRDGRTEYEYEIDASTGTIRKADVDYDD